jgi:hypothetical protein
MSMCRNSNGPLLILAALLTLTASGDDINLLRVALPSAFALSPNGSFPLDDENTDFIKPPESLASQAQLMGPTLLFCRSVEKFEQIPTPLSSAPASPDSTHCQLSGDSTMTPLRC